MKRHVVKLSSAPPGGSLVVDGQDLSNATRGFTFTARAGEMPALTVDLRVDDISADGEVADIVIPTETRAALMALGWTPPEET